MLSLLFCGLLSRLGKGTYFLLFLSLFWCSLLQQNYDLEFGIIKNPLHKGSASKKYGILKNKWVTDFYLQVKLAVIKGFLYICLASLRMSKMFKSTMARNYVKWTEKGNRDWTWGTPEVVCPALHIPSVSAEQAEAQLSAVEQPQLSMTSRWGHTLGIVVLVSLFPLLLVVLLSAASASPLLNSDTFPADICSSFRTWSAACRSGTDLHHSSHSSISLFIFPHCLIQHLLPFSLSSLQPSSLVHQLSAVHIHLLAVTFP